MAVTDLSNVDYEIAAYDTKYKVMCQQFFLCRPYPSACWQVRSRLILVAAVISLLAAQTARDPSVGAIDEALSSGNVQRVHELEQQLLTANKSLDTLLAAGVLLGEHELLADASAVFERAIEQYPASFEARYNFALARIGLSDYRKALDTLRKMSPRSGQETAAVEYLKGKIYSNTNRLQEARQNLEGAYRSNPEEENYALDLGLIDIRLEAYIPAIEVLKPALARHPHSQELSLELALSEALAGRRADATALCRKLLDEHPEQTLARLIAAFSECMDNDYLSCERESSAGLASPDPHAYFHYLHAKALWESGSTNTGKVLADLNQAMAKMPGCNVCLLLRSRVLESRNDNAAAITDLKTALHQDPQMAPAWYRLSVLYRKTGQNTEASAALRRYRDLRDDQTANEIENFRNQFVRILGQSGSQSSSRF